MTTRDYTFCYFPLSSSKSSFSRANLGGGCYRIRELDNGPTATSSCTISRSGSELGTGLLSAIINNCSPPRVELIIFNVS